jgi:hypothetical protein
MVHIIQRICLYLLTKTNFWSTQSTIKDVELVTNKTKLPGSTQEYNHNIFVAYEAGRHKLLMDLHHYKYGLKQS